MESLKNTHTPKTEAAIIKMRLNTLYTKGETPALNYIHKYMKTNFPKILDDPNYTLSSFEKEKISAKGGIVDWQNKSLEEIVKELWGDLLPKKEVAKILLESYKGIQE